MYIHQTKLYSRWKPPAGYKECDVLPCPRYAAGATPTHTLDACLMSVCGSCLSASLARRGRLVPAVGVARFAGTARLGARSPPPRRRWNSAWPRREALSRRPGAGDQQRPARGDGERCRAGGHGRRAGVCVQQRGCQVLTLLATYKRLLKGNADVQGGWRRRGRCHRCAG